MYSQQIDYISFEFLVLTLSGLGLPKLNERNVAWEKVEACGFKNVFREDQKQVIR
jgi:hypothetical protein